MVLKFSRLNSKAGLLTVATVIVVAWFLWPAPNTLARYRVRNILLSDRTPDEMLTALRPYVKLGDSSLAVAQRLSPTPHKAKEATQATDLGYGLEGVNLQLLIRRDGRIAAIGRYVHGKPGGVEWFAKPTADWACK